MDEVRVLLVFPGSLDGGAWAAGPRIKPQLVGAATELRRAGHAVTVLDLEVEAGAPEDDVERAAFLERASALIGAADPEVAILTCTTALQYRATVAVADRIRELHPGAVIAVAGYQVSVRPDDFNDPGAPFDWLVAGEPENALVNVAGMVASGEARPGGCRSVEGTPLALDAAHLPDYGAYPYIEDGLPSLGVILSRGCPYNSPACMLRPGGAGWHAYPPDVVIAMLKSLESFAPRRVDVLDPAFGYDAGWRRTALDRLALLDEREVLFGISARPADLERGDADKIYHARLGLRLEVRTLSPTLLSRTAQAPNPARAVAHAVELIEFLNAKGVATRAHFLFGQPGETAETASETLDALERFVAAAPNASVTLHAVPWAFLPVGDRDMDVTTPAARFGTRILHSEWWKEAGPAAAAATAVVPSKELEALPPGDQSYWRPRFEELCVRLDEKLTSKARRGLRSHETVGSGASGVPQDGWMEGP